MKMVPVVTNLNELSMKHLILYEHDVKLLRLREVPYSSICDMLEVRDFDY